MTTAEGTAQIGVVGLAVMGSNIARNFANNGHTVAVYNRTTAKTDKFMEDFGETGNFVPSETIADFVKSLERPRRALIMVQAGAGTDAVISQLAAEMDEGDIIIDGGNALYTDTIRREAEMSERGLNFVGAGISGGEEGALNGPAIMPGGPAESWEALGPLLESVAAKVDGTPCVTHIGPDGAGHFVKMVHNGIEYADMQVIGEAYQLLRYGAGMEPAEIAEVFKTWNEGDLDSYLIEITAEVLSQTDEKTGKPLIDVIVDSAGQKGTGRWTVKAALDLGIPTTGIGEAVFARALSGAREQRDATIGNLPSGELSTLDVPKEEFIEDVRRALYASKLVAYAQGFDEDQGGLRGAQVGRGPPRPGHHLARRLHHPREVPEPHPRGLRRERGTALPAAGSVLQGRAGRPDRLLAPRGHPGYPAGPAGAGVRIFPVLLRLAARRAPAGGSDPGPARLLRRPHLPPYRPRGLFPHPLVRRP